MAKQYEEFDYDDFLIEELFEDEPTLEEQLADVETQIKDLRAEKAVLLDKIAKEG